MLTVATQRSAPPYLAVTAGPASHSPPPIAEAPITSPGPIIASAFFQVNRGASINSPVSHRGIAFVPGCGATKLAGDSAVTAMRILPGEKCRPAAYHRLRRSPGQLSKRLTLSPVRQEVGSQRHFRTSVNALPAS